MGAKVRLMFLALAFMVGTISSAGSAMTKNIDDLHGIKSVLLYVAVVTPSGLDCELNAGELSRDVELKLRLAGIKVLKSMTKFTENSPQLIQSWEAEGRPQLWISVFISNSFLSGKYSFRISVRLKQDVLIARAPSTVIVSTTWEDEDWFEKTGAIKDIRDAIKDSMDKFLNDYLTINPK